MTYQADISSWTGHELVCFCFVFHRFLHELTLIAQQQLSSNCSWVSGCFSEVMSKDIVLKLKYGKAYSFIHGLKRVK